MASFNVRSAAEAASARTEAPWGSLTWLASGEINGCEGLTLGRVVIHSGQGNPRHTHETCDEVLYLMSGSLSHSIGDETVLMEAGDTIFVPGGAVHHAVSVGDGDADMIVVYSSGRRDFVPEADGQSE